MRAFLIAVLGGVLSTGAAWAGVVPNQGAQSMSGAKIKAPSHEQEKQAGDTAEKEEAPRDDKR